jgi:hypothetical protein
VHASILAEDLGDVNSLLFSLKKRGKLLQIRDVDTNKGL